MTTALQIVNRAAELVGYKDPSETLSGDDSSSFLGVLNSLVDGWNTSRMYVVATAEVSATVSASPVSIGAGQTLATARPVRIESGFVRSNGVDSPLEWLTAAEYDAISDKAASGTPSQAFYSPGVPYGAIYLWPVPSSASLHVRVMAQLSEFANLATDYSLAPGYRKALEYSLAEELFPSRTTPQIVRIAQNARRAIKLANFEPLKLEGSDMAQRIAFNILSGE